MSAWKEFSKEEYTIRGGNAQCAARSNLNKLDAPFRVLLTGLVSRYEWKRVDECSFVLKVLPGTNQLCRAWLQVYQHVPDAEIASADTMCFGRAHLATHPNEVIAGVAVKKAVRVADDVVAPCRVVADQRHCMVCHALLLRNTRFAGNCLSATRSDLIHPVHTYGNGPILEKRIHNLVVRCIGKRAKGLAHVFRLESHHGRGVRGTHARVEEWAGGLLRGTV
mmetsp:Transcript_17256/g.49331  ORF Transcript_17256/g.49331 Transcript_17256/m.49331 type:complete len:222 (+) Transcript_17256:818-1483(+)